MTVFGEELRRLRRAAGVSLSELAGRVHYSKSHLSKVENGRARPNLVLATLCDHEFGTRGTLAGLVPRRPTRRRKNVLLLEIRAQIPTMPAPLTRPAADDLKLAMLLGVPDATADCAAPDVGEAIVALCCTLRLHGLCGEECIFVGLRSRVETGAERYTC
jgi:transcriptional regulator with XRE-family HTH domain